MSALPDRLVAALADRYRLERELGQGGMATVYLAEDLKHHRPVAIKVLRPELAAVLGAERFVQEITTTAQLQHPHILPLFDSGQADSFLYYVMPYIEGETLRAKLDREKQLSVEEAVRITREVADALDYAHRHGVIHRDIKPENILLHDGRPMVADFGIALAVSAAAGGRMTETGMSLGTPHYMSPEQATAEKDITARSDIYSLASVLYEMLTGDPPHTGASAQQIILKIIAEPVAAVTGLRKSVPPNVAAALAKALEKLSADRFATAKEFAAALVDPHFSARVPAATSPASARKRVPTLALVGGALVVGLIAGALARGGPDSRPQHHPARVQIVLPADVTLPLDHDYPVLAVSPDGTRLVFVGEREGRRQLYVKLFAAAEATVIEGTEGALMPFFSPDGRWIGYMEGFALHRVPVTGGSPTPMVAGPGEGVNRGVAWTPGSVLLVAGVNGGLKQVDVGGDSVVAGFAAPQLTGGPGSAYWPTAVPAGSDIVFAAPDEQASHTDVGLYQPRSGRTRILINGAAAPQVASGQLLFARGASLHVVQYDASRGATQGPERPLVSGVAAGGDGVSHYAVGGDVLAYVSGDATSPARELVWVDRSGGIVRVEAEPRQYSSPRIAPDGRRVAVTISDGPGDVWLLDLNRATLQPLTRDPGEDFSAVWSPDGRSLALSTEVGEAKGEMGPALGLMARLGDPIEQLTFSPAAGSWEFPTSWVPDGRSIVVTSRVAGKGDVVLFRLDSADMVPLVASPAEEFGARVSPDARWLAYVSNESGRSEVWVRPFGRPGTAVQVSTSGGLEPMWSPDGRELFYRVAEDMMAVPLVGDARESTPGRPRRLFTGRYDYTLIGGGEANYDVSPDGRRFLMVRRVRSVRPTVIQVVFDWPSALLSAEGVTP